MKIKYEFFSGSPDSKKLDAMEEVCLFLEEKGLHPRDVTLCGFNRDFSDALCKTSNIYKREIAVFWTEDN